MAHGEFTLEAMQGALVQFSRYFADVNIILEIVTMSAWLKRRYAKSIVYVLKWIQNKSLPEACILVNLGLIWLFLGHFIIKS